MTVERKTPSNIASESFPTIDVLKFLFAILIMCLHGHIFQESQFGLYFEKIIVRLAVPFFFVSSGFFYGKKVYAKRNTRAITKSYVSRLAVKLLIFEPISILIEVAYNIVVYQFSVPVTMVRAIQNILFYPLGALWYIQAVIVAIVLLLPFMERNREYLALWIGLILYLFALSCNRYFFLWEGTVMERVVDTYMHYFISARNGIFVGFLYVSMGVLIAGKWTVLVKKDTLFGVLMLVSALGLILEVCFTNNKTGLDDNALFITHLVLIPSLFIYAGCRNVGWAEKYINAPLLRNLSTSIYLLHSPALKIIRYGSKLVFDAHLQPWQITAMAGTVLALICFVVYRKKWNPYYSWIK